MKQIGCATSLISKRLNITLEVSTIAESKYNGVEKADGYVGSNPTIFTEDLWSEITSPSEITCLRKYIGISYSIKNFQKVHPSRKHVRGL